MTDIIASALYGKELKIVKDFKQGGQGVILETDDPCVLVKQFEPAFITDDTKRQQDLRQRMERAYPAFCAVNKGTQAELSCLPREYVQVRGNPGYLMRKAEGELLQTFLRQKKITAENRFHIAYALARAMKQLRSAQLVHADANPENYVVKNDAPGWTVYVLDIDGGGLLSPPGPVYPISQPKRLYKAPELSRMNWQQLRERDLFFAPDHWALAVLLYQMLVDYAGPFCPVKKHPNPAVKGYIPFKPYAYRDTASHWPMPWQEKLMCHAELPDRIIALFYETFQHRFALEKRPRPTAALWEEALRRTLSPGSAMRMFALPVTVIAAHLHRPAAWAVRSLRSVYPERAKGMTVYSNAHPQRSPR